MSGHHTIWGIGCLDLLIHVIIGSGSVCAISNSCVDQLLAYLRGVNLSSAASYVSTRTDTAFFSYCTSTTTRVGYANACGFGPRRLYDPERIKGWLMDYQKVLKLGLAVVDGKVGSLLPFLSLRLLIFRAYGSVITGQPSRYSCTTSETLPPQRHTALSAETSYPGKSHTSLETIAHCLLPFSRCR